MAVAFERRKLKVVCLLVINTLPEKDEPRYRVYDKDVACTISWMVSLSFLVVPVRRNATFALFKVF